MPNKAIVSINGAFNQATYENWSLAVGQDATLKCNVNTAGESGAAWNTRVTAYLPDGRTLFTNSASSMTSNIAEYTILAANTNGHYPGPYTYEVVRTDSGFVAPLAYGTINLYKP